MLFKPASDHCLFLDHVGGWGEGNERKTDSNVIIYTYFFKYIKQFFYPSLICFRLATLHVLASRETLITRISSFICVYPSYSSSYVMTLYMIGSVGLSQAPSAQSTEPSRGVLVPQEEGGFSGLAASWWLSSQSIASHTACTIYCT